MPLAAFPHNHYQNIDTSEREMNPVTMTMLNPWKKYWPSQGSNQRLVLKSCTLWTELWGSAGKICKHLVINVVLARVRGLKAVSLANQT